jgi:hypothetical protein
MIGLSPPRKLSKENESFLEIFGILRCLGIKKFFVNFGSTL